MSWSWSRWVSFGLLFVACGLPGRPEEQAVRTLGLYEVKERLRRGEFDVFEEIVGYPTGVALQRLASVISVYTKTTVGENDEEIASMASRALARVPGHAEYIEERINELTLQKWTAGKRRIWMSLLGRSRSSESLSVLGKMLYDERAPQTEDDVWKMVQRASDQTIDVLPNSTLAAQAINAMNLPSAPLQGFEGHRQHAIHAWRTWWEVKGRIEVESLRAVRPSPLSAHAADRQSVPVASVRGRKSLWIPLLLGAIVSIVVLQQLRRLRRGC